MPAKRGCSPGLWRAAARDFDAALSQGFVVLAGALVRHPLLAVLVSVLVSCILAIGLQGVEVLYRVEDVLVPQDAASRVDAVRASSTFGSLPRAQELLFTAAGDVEDRNVLSKDIFDEIWRLHAQVLSITTADGQDYGSLCYRPSVSSSCATKGALRFWGDNETLYTGTVTDGSRLREALSATAYADGSPVARELVFGEYITSPGDGGIGDTIDFAEGVTVSYILDAATSAEEEGPQGESSPGKAALEWELAFLEAASQPLEHARVYRNAARSVDDELSPRMVAGDRRLLAVSCMVFTVLCSVFLGGVCRPCSMVGSRIGLGLSGVCLIAVAVAAGHGVCVSFGVPFTALNGLVPFALVGIGTDNMFTMCSAFDGTSPSLPAEDRVKEAMGKCAPSLACTAVAVCAVFGLGAAASVPAVRYFALCSATGAAALLAVQVTAFVPAVYVDAWRQGRRRLDLCCCFKGAPPKAPSPRKHVPHPAGKHIPSPPPAAPAQKAAAPAAKPPPAAGGRPAVHLRPSARKKLDAAVKRARANRLLHAYCNLLLGSNARVAVLLGFLGALAGGIHVGLQVQQGLDILDMLPSSSYAHDYVSRCRGLNLPLASERAAVHFLDLPFADPTTQQAMLDTEQDLMLDEHMSGSRDSWLADFLAWAAAQPSHAAHVSAGGLWRAGEDLFQEALAEFLTQPGYSRHKSDLLLEGGQLRASRSWMYHINVGQPQDQAAAMTSARDVAAGADLDPEPFLFTSMYWYGDLHAAMRSDLTVNLVWAMVALLATSALFLGHEMAAVLVVMLVAAAGVEIFATIQLWGMDTGSEMTIAVVPLLIAMGLLVGDATRFLYCFISQDPDRSADVNVRLALDETAPVAVLSALALFLGTVPLAVASSAMYRSLFKVLVGVTALRLWHSLVLLPVMVSLCGEAIQHSNQQSKEARGSGTVPVSWPGSLETPPPYSPSLRPVASINATEGCAIAASDRGVALMLGV